MHPKVCRIGNRCRWGADHIAYEVGLAASTVQSILNQAGLGRLDRGDRATDSESVKSYQRDTPGELIHTSKMSEAFKIHETEVPHGSSLTWLMGVLGGVLVPISAGLGTTECLSASN